MIVKNSIDRSKPIVVPTLDRLSKLKLGTLTANKSNLSIKFLLNTFIFIFIICGILVGKRNQIWANEIALWSDSVIKNPSSPRVHNNLGKAYYEVGKLKIARSHLEKSVSSIPGYAKTQFNLGNPKHSL